MAEFDIEAIRRRAAELRAAAQQQQPTPTQPQATQEPTVAENAILQQQTQQLQAQQPTAPQQEPAPVPTPTAADFVEKAFNQQYAADPLFNPSNVPATRAGLGEGVRSAGENALASLQGLGNAERGLAAQQQADQDQLSRRQGLAERFPGQEDRLEKLTALGEFAPTAAVAAGTGGLLGLITTGAVASLTNKFEAPTRKAAMNSLLLDTLTGALVGSAGKLAGATIKGAVRGAKNVVRLVSDAPTRGAINAAAKVAKQKPKIPYKYKDDAIKALQKSKNARDALRNLIGASGITAKEKLEALSHATGKPTTSKEGK